MSFEETVEKMSCNLRQTQTKVEQLETSLQAYKDQCHGLQSEALELKACKERLEHIEVELTQTCQSKDSKIGGLEEQLSQVQSQLELSEKVRTKTWKLN